MIEAYRMWSLQIYPQGVLVDRRWNLPTGTTTGTGAMQIILYFGKLRWVRRF